MGVPFPATGTPDPTLASAGSYLIVIILVAVLFILLTLED